MEMANGIGVCFRVPCVQPDDLSVQRVSLGARQDPADPGWQFLDGFCPLRASGCHACSVSSRVPDEHPLTEGWQDGLLEGRGRKTAEFVERRTQAGIEIEDGREAVPFAGIGDR